jgi:hypothetical protein
MGPLRNNFCPSIIALFTLSLARQLASLKIAEPELTTVAIDQKRRPHTFSSHVPAETNTFHRRAIVAPGGTVQALPVRQTGSRDAAVIVR